MELTQEQNQIIREYKKLKKRLEKAPNSKQFYEVVPIGKCQNAFPKDTFSTIQTLAGDKPRKFGQEGRSEDEYFEIYGKAIRNITKRVPTQIEWRSHKIKPFVCSYYRYLKIKWKQMPLAFIDWAIDKSEWEDVVKICEKYCREKNLFQEESKATTTNYGYVYLMKANKKGQYKIGKADSPGRRANQLSQLDPHDRNYEHVLETTDPFGLEEYWKKRFKDKHVRKEIYELSKEDVIAFKEFYVKEAPKTY